MIEMYKYRPTARKKNYANRKISKGYKAMVSVAWHGVEGENENRFIIYLNFWYVDFPLSLCYKKKK